MFLNKYLDEFYLSLLYDKYDEDFLNNIDEENFNKVYNIFKKYNFYFIDDIILNYLAIFLKNFQEVEEKILLLKDLLKDKFVYIIGEDMTYLSFILDENKNIWGE